MLLFCITSIRAPTMPAEGAGVGGAESVLSSLDLSWIPCRIWSRSASLPVLDTGLSFCSTFFSWVPSLI